MGAIRSRARAHEAPSPACGGRLGWGPSEVAHERTKPLPPLAGEGWDGGHPKSRESARSPFPRSRGKVGMGAIRSRARAHEAPSPVHGGRLGWGPSEVAHERTKPLPPFTGEGWDGGAWRLQPTARSRPLAAANGSCLATARRPPPSLPPLARREECRVHPKSRTSAPSPFPRLRGKAGMGASGSRTAHTLASQPPAVVVQMQHLYAPVMRTRGNSLDTPPPPRLRRLPVSIPTRQEATT
jgi:hypothetical protein